MANELAPGTYSISLYTEIFPKLYFDAGSKTVNVPHPIAFVVGIREQV